MQKVDSILELEETVPDENSLDDKKESSSESEEKSSSDDESESDTDSLPEYDNVPCNQATVGRPKKHLRGTHSQPRLAVPVEGSGVPPPTPSKYQVVPDCDVCDVSCCAMGCGLQGDSNDPVKSVLIQSIISSTSSPHVNVNPPAYEVDRGDGKGTFRRKTLGIPML
jgi:hypothetical protein